MIEALQLIFVLLVIPAGLAWAAAKYGRLRNPVVAPVAIVISAALPALWVFYETQQADGITRAASIVVTPFLFLVMLIPAALGYAVGKPREPS